MKRLYESVKEEIPDPKPGVVTGNIPDWLNGSLYRNGPGLFEVGKTKYNHLFDGMAVIQRFHVKKQEVTYQRRFLQSETYKTNMVAKRIAVTEFGTVGFPDPCKGVIARAVSFVTESSQPTDNTNVTISSVGEHLYTASEATILHRINPETLETIGKVTLPDHIPISQAAAHTHTDNDGTVHSVAYQFGKGPPKYCIFKTPPYKGDKGGYPESKVCATVTAEHSMHPSYFHTFGITAKYYVFVEQPLLMNVWKILAAKMKKEAMLPCIQWDPVHNNNQTRFHVIERGSGAEVNTTFPFVAEAFLVLHHINAFEDQGHLIVDVCGYHEGDIISKFDLATMTSDKVEEAMMRLPRPEPRRYVLPLSVDEKTKEGTNLVNLAATEATAILRNKQILCNYAVLCTESMELPQINYEFNGKPYNFFYGVGLTTTLENQHAINKVNVRDKSVISWQEGDCFPSEAVFVGRPGAVEEDDGVLLSVVGDVGKNEDFLLILDARTLKETARVVFPGVHFPRDQHGTFIKDA